MAHALGEHFCAHFQHGRILWNKVECGFAAVTSYLLIVTRKAPATGLLLYFAKSPDSDILIPNLLSP
jgi:hypothetical protein